MMCPARRLVLACACASAVVGGARPAAAQTAENVAVVINDESPESQRIGEYYVRKRAIPMSNVVRIRTSREETVPRQVYAGTIEAPIAAFLTRGGLQDRILYLVLTRDVPLRIEGEAGPSGTVSSVDSELTLLYRRMTGASVPAAGRVDNPYHLGSADPAAWRPFGHRDHDIYLVTRLDAFTVDEALALVDRGSAPVTEGRVVLDQQDKLVNRTGEDWLEEAASRLKSGGHGERVVLETTPQGARGISPVLGYYSWGSNDPRNRVRTFDMGFVPGSLAAMFVSSDGRTFAEPPDGWVPSGDTNRSAWFAGTPQSLMGDLIREGATGVAGHVAEPYLQSTIRPEILFPAYLAGANLAEAFYAAMPHLSWQTIVVGDPLCAPFRTQPIARQAIDEGVDAETTLPALFAERRVANMLSQSPGASRRGAALAVRGEALLARGDAAAAREAFEQAADVSPQIVGVQLQLALMHEQAGEHEEAHERYRRVIDLQPRSVVALNNLAYGLAVHAKQPAEGLPFAERAVELDPRSPVILDTLAWIQHLLMDNTAAVKSMADALKYAPNHAEIRLHAAVIYAAAGARAVAEDNLREALRLDPALERNPDVERVRAALQKLGTPK